MANNKDYSQTTPDTAIGGMQSGRLAEMPGISNQRRKLIKASVATIPALMTLRSGAAAAVASSYQCLNHGATTDNKILGDNDSDPSHDQWVRVEAKPGKVVTYKNGNNTINLYCIRVSSPPANSWDLITGWDFYDSNGAAIKNLPNSAAFRNAWSNATTFYYVPTDTPPGFVCTVANGMSSGKTICPVIPGPVINKVTASQFTVQLLAYVEFYPDGSVSAITHFPNQSDSAVPFTASCLCSIDPTFQQPG
jgi:hypothetical protein